MIFELAQIPDITQDLPPNEWLGKLLLWIIVFSACGVSGWAIITKRKSDGDEPDASGRRVRYGMIESAITDLRKDMDDRFESERSVAREAQGNVHKRIDQLLQVTYEMRGELKSTREAVDATSKATVSALQALSARDNTIAKLQEELAKSQAGQWTTKTTTRPRRPQA